MQGPVLPRLEGTGWIILIGGGEFTFGETREIDDFLVSLLPSSNPRIAFLPAASGSSEYAGHLGKHFQTVSGGVEVINVPIYRRRDGNRPKNLHLLRSAGLIYIGGGVTSAFLEAIRGSKADEALKEAVQAGVHVAAMGASANGLGRVARDPARAGGWHQGLNWIPDAAIESSFDSSNDTALRRLMSVPEVRLGVGIPRSTAIAIAPDGRSRILGSQSIAVVRKSGAASVQ
jgi:cyanophycinase-like exopeptidase